MLDIRRYIKNYSDVSIDRPIFLLGTQGGGLTLVSRMIRRNRSVVSISGNRTYWAGADEMKSVLGPILPRELKAVEYLKPYPPLVRIPRDWHCGIDRYVDIYRNTEKDVTAETKDKFRRILRWIIGRHSHGMPGRFTDKSQIYTLKVSFLYELLKDCDPKFILITRNPYAMCYRTAKGNSYTAESMELELSFSERLELACQHWNNYMKYALEDSKKVKAFLIIKYESVLQDPETELRKICTFTELDFDNSMIPKAEDKVPFGSMRRNRWYPLNRNSNKKYLDEIKQEHIDLIVEHCKKYGEMFGYEKPRAL